MKATWWLIIDPDDEPRLDLIARSRESAMRYTEMSLPFLESHAHWPDLHRLGWRCVPLKVEWEEER